MDEVRYPPLVTAGVLVVCALSCLAGFESYLDTADYHAAQKDTYLVGETERRFAGAAAKLPRGQMVGYITDLQPGSVQNTTAFLAAQYALAPNLLVSVNPKVRSEWVVGNFAKDNDNRATEQALGVKVVQDFGNGVVLYRKEAR